MRELKLLVEATKSRRGRHVARAIVVVVRSDGRVEISTPAEDAKGTYSRGKAGFARVYLNNGDVAVWIKLVRNLLGRVIGTIIVYDHRGREVLRLVYKRFKIRRSKGDPSYWPVVERVLRLLKLEDKVRRVNLNTGVE